MPFVRSRTPAALLLLALAGCPADQPLGPTAELAPGRYALHSINGYTLPTTAPCGVFRIVEGQVRLASGRLAEHHQRYVPIHGGKEVTYRGEGSFREVGDTAVVLTLTGRWSHTPESFTHKLHLRRTAQGLTRLVGMECDGADVELYRMP